LTPSVFDAPRLSGIVGCLSSRRQFVFQILDMCARKASTARRGQFVRQGTGIILRFTCFAFIRVDMGTA